MNEHLQRTRSLDTLRGAAVALMILVNNPGSFRHLYSPLAHAGWNGCTLADLVFPFFLFAVGMSLSIVMPGLARLPEAEFWKRVLKRAGIIFGLGLLLNAAPFVRWDLDGNLVLRDLGQLRWMGVLQRIGLTWLLATVVLRLGGPKSVFLSITTLLLGYWLACTAWGDANDPYGLFGWFGRSVDVALLGESHLYRAEGIAFDPEGLASTAPAVAQVLIGWFVGHRLWSEGPRPETVVRLFLLALGMGVLAYFWQLGMPLNKKIWTSSYVLLSSAVATATLATLVWALDMGWVRHAVPNAFARGFELLGRHALALFVVSGLVPRVLMLIRWKDGTDGAGAVHYTSPLPWIYENLFAPLTGDPRMGSLLFALVHVAAYFALARWLQRKRFRFHV